MAGPAASPSLAHVRDCSLTLRRIQQRSTRDLVPIEATNLATVSQRCGTLESNLRRNGRGLRFIPVRLERHASDHGRLGGKLERPAQALGGEFERGAPL